MISKKLKLKKEKINNSEIMGFVEIEYRGNEQ